MRRPRKNAPAKRPISNAALTQNWEVEIYADRMWNRMEFWIQRYVYFVIPFTQRERCVFYLTLLLLHKLRFPRLTWFLFIDWNRQTDRRREGISIAWLDIAPRFFMAHPAAAHSGTFQRMEAEQWTFKAIFPGIHLHSTYCKAHEKSS